MRKRDQKHADREPVGVARCSATLAAVPSVAPDHIDPEALSSKRSPSSSGRGDGRVVVEQDARWVDVATGEEQGRARVASQFLVDRTRIARYVRHDDGLPAALSAAQLGDSDEVTERQAL